MKVAAILYFCITGQACHTQEIRVEPRYCHLPHVVADAHIGDVWLPAEAYVKCGR